MRYLLLLLFFIPGNIFSQTFEKNINLPNDDSGGSIVADILIANDKLFAYSTDGISIYDASDNSFEKKIFFTETLGKFNPVYHDPRLYSPEQSIMVYNNHDTFKKYVYALTPKLDLLIINTDNLDQTWTVQLQVEEEGEELYLKDHLDSQSGRVILKYDNNNGHERLYLLINSRDNDGTGNTTGGFHEQRIIFAIYKVNYNVPLNDAPIIDLHYSEINKAAGGTYGLQINNYVFNETNDFFYIVRLGTRFPSSIAKIEVREFTESSTEFVQDFDFENIGTSASGYHKMGKMLYIHDVNTSPNIHKVLIFPYRYFQGDIPSPRFCVIDIHDNNTHSISYIDSPSKRIHDAVYLEDRQDIVISYAPDNNQIPNANYHNTNIAVFHYDLSSNGIALTQFFDNDNSTNTSNLDINSSFFLTKLDGSSIFISKKDGIDKLEWDNTLQEPKYVYSENGLLNAENNFFMEGIREGSNTYINNLVSNGIEIYDNTNGVFQNSLRTGYPVYHVIANGDGSRQIYHNKLESYNTGFYCYSYLPEDNQNPAEEIYVNINDDNYTNNNIETAIGDIVYNPFQDHFLITKFEKGSAKIMIINGSDYSYSDIVLNLENDSPGTQFATEMFVSPKGMLYIWANMNNDENKKPTIFIYNANNYSYITNVVVDADFDFTKSYTNYTAQFCYNPHDETVVTTITVQEHKLMPYNTEASSIYDVYNTPETPDGKLLVLSDELEGEIIPLEYFPGKIIFPGTDENYESSQYYGKIFIIGDKLHEYNYLNSGQINYLNNMSFIDITYNVVNDMLFAIKEISLGGEHRAFEIWTIYYENDILKTELYTLDNLTEIGGQIASIFSNPYDGRTYIYQKVDAEKLGDNDVSLYSFNPSDENPTWEITHLGIATYYPDYDHTYNLAEHNYNNRITPYINPYTNHIYLPNGGHSCISKVSFTPIDQLILEPGINWISIPRHEGNTGLFKGMPGPGEEYDYDNHLTSEVLKKGNFEGEYSMLQLAYNAGEGGQEEIVYAEYNIEQTNNWEYDDDMEQTYSYRGYKLNTYQELANILTLEGKIENPNTPIKLIENKENWVGYFLYKSQWPFDAIPEDVLEELTSIKAQGWHCQKRLENHEGEPVYYWACAVYEGDVALNYGDMVILTSDATLNFQWQTNGIKPPVVDKMETEYYQYNEQPDYTSYFIELDTTENPQEIAAFIGDSCVGATTVLANDTLVLVPGYTEGISGGVVFEEYYGSQKSKKPTINEYFVSNNKTGTIRKRTINTKEKHSYYFISFKTNNEHTNSTKPEAMFFVYPNPVNNMLNINYSIENTSKVNISVFDSYGRCISTLFNSNQPKGSFGLQWNISGNNGNKVPKGLYIIKLKINDVITSKKVVVN